MNQILRSNSKVLLTATILFMCFSSTMGQFINYSTIENNIFYLSAKHDEASVIEAYQIGTKTLPKVTKLRLDQLPFYIPFSWKIEGDELFTINSAGKYPTSRFQVGVMGICALEQKDSIELAKEHLILKDSISALSEKEQSDAWAYEGLKRLMKGRGNGIFPIIDRFDILYSEKNALAKSIAGLSYDFLIDDDNYTLFLRADKDFTIWKAPYPRKGKTIKRLDWKESITYTLDSLYNSPFDNSKVGNKRVPSSEKHIFQAINDPLFFYGHFTIFQQGKSLFIFNSNQGGIYHIGKKSIDKVGQLREYKGSREKGLINYPNWIFGQRIFIEDKDNEQLIILKYHVEQLRKDLPFPKIRTVESKEELEKILPFL